ncbi:MAG: TonB-dependent receptor [Burkholderiales bacterium]|nr:TonB-dependent receptor [Bacteroidia bacterium]
MKKNNLLILFIGLSLLSQAQTITIRDKSSREPLPDVVILDKNNMQVKTDIKGKAVVSSLQKEDSLFIYQFGYATQKVMIFEGNDASVDLTAKTVNLDEVIFSANRKAESKIDVPYQIAIIKQKDIEFSNPATSGDLLQNTGQVFLQKSQAGGGSPGLRGFEANKVLLVVDGVRMNNAIYRGGHLQDVMTIDPNMLERAEVLFGPSSTIYGSDALGGVMHFYTKNAQFSPDDKMLVKANSLLRFASAAQEKTGHLDFNLGWKRFASLTNITFSDFGDLMSGSTKLSGYTNTWDRNYYVKRFDNRDSMVKTNNNNLQTGTAYKQIDLMQRFMIKTGEHLTHNLNFQLSTSSFVPRYDRLAGDYSGGKLKFAENGYGPQNRLLAAYTLNFDKKTIVSDNIKVILAYQKINQERITRRFQNTNRKIQMEDVAVLSANIDIYKVLAEKHELRYGLEITNNNVNSVAKFKDINTNAELPADTRYADGGSKMSTTAIYLSHAWEVNKNFIITDGLRFTNTNLTCNFKDTTFYKFPFTKAQQKNQALTGNLGFTWKSEDDYKVSLLTSTGFRSPNVDDMSKVFESSGSTVIVPNPELKPEYTYNFELNLSKVVQGRYKFDLTGYYTNLTNALVIKDFKLNGNDSAMYNGTKSKVQATQNVDRAYIYGLNGGVQFDFNSNVSFKSVLNYTYGRYIDAKNDTVVPLDHIAPLFGQTSILYKGKSVDGEFFVRYNGKKATNDYSPSGEDNAAYSADKVLGYMPGWFTLNIRLGVNLTKALRLNLACENITDNRYRVFASGINAAGRNVIVSLRYKM